MKIKKFRKIYDDDAKFVSEPGDPIAIDYMLQIDSDGVGEIVECGKTDLYASIQSHRDSVDLDMILKRYAEGDASALDRVRGFYADLSKMDMNYANLMNMNLRGQKLFESLPSDIREEYGNDYIQFIARGIGNLDISDAAGVVPDEGDEVKQEVKSDE